MQNNSSNNDPREIWQSQPREIPVMTLEEIRQRGQKLQAKTRRTLLGWRALALLIVSISIFGITWTHSPIMRATFALSIVWSLAGQFLVNRKKGSPMPTEDALVSTGLKSYRTEVERRRYISAHFLLSIFGPSVLAVGTLAAQIISLARAQGALSKIVPFMTALAIWIVGVFIIRMRDQRQLQGEINNLSLIENSNQ